MQTGPNPVGPGLVAQATPTSAITVGAATGGGSVNFSGTGGTRVLTGISAGTVGVGSTDAVNGAQLSVTQAGVLGSAASLGGGAKFDPATGTYTAPTYAVQGSTYNTVGGAVAALDSSGVKYDRNADGSTNFSSVTLGNGTGPTVVSNVAAGLVAAGSTQAVNGGQLYDTNSRVDTLTKTAVQYDVDPATGGKTNTVTLAGADPNTPVIVRNVGAGTLNTDAANTGQVRAAQATSMAYTDQRAAQTLQDSKTYTDQQISSANLGNEQAFARLNQDIGQVRREARQAAAVGLAAASLRYDDRPGKISLAAGGGAWRGEGAAAFGVGYTTENGLARFNIGATTTAGQWGVGGGVSLTLN